MDGEAIRNPGRLLKGVFVFNLLMIIDVTIKETYRTLRLSPLL